MKKDKLKALANWVLKEIPPEKLHFGSSSECVLHHVSLRYTNMPKKYIHHGAIKYYSLGRELYGLTDPQWHFLFSAVFIHDPSPQSFAKRVEYLLKGGSLPDQWWNLVRAKDFFYH